MISFVTKKKMISFKINLSYNTTSLNIFDWDNSQNTIHVTNTVQHEQCRNRTSQTTQH